VPETNKEIGPVSRKKGPSKYKSQPSHFAAQFMSTCVYSTLRCKTTLATSCVGGTVECNSIWTRAALRHSEKPKLAQLLSSAGV